MIGSIDYMSKVMDLSVSRQLAEKYGESFSFSFSLSSSFSSSSSSFSSSSCFKYYLSSIVN